MALPFGVMLKHFDFDARMRSPVPPDIMAGAHRRAPACAACSWTCRRCPSLLIKTDPIAPYTVPLTALGCPEQAEDMRAGVEWLGAQGLRAIGLLGHSKGGSGVVLYAAKYDDVPRVVNVSGRFDMQRGARLQPAGSLSNAVEAQCLYVTFPGHSMPREHGEAHHCAPAVPDNATCRFLWPCLFLSMPLSAQLAAPKRALRCAAGVVERFGKEVLERLEREGNVPMEWRGGRGRQPLRWTLTKQACSACSNMQHADHPATPISSAAACCARGQSALILCIGCPFIQLLGCKKTQKKFKCRTWRTGCRWTWTRPRVRWRAARCSPCTARTMRLSRWPTRTHTPRAWPAGGCWWSMARTTTTGRRAPPTRSSPPQWRTSPGLPAKPGAQADMHAASLVV